MLYRGFLFLLACIAGTAPAVAQIGVYGSLSAAKFNVPNTDWEYGSTFGLYDNRWHVPFFALGVDGRGTVVSSGNVDTESGLVGPRLVFQPHILPVMPYVEALVGAGHIGAGQGSAVINETKFEYDFVGGVDYTFFPRLDWRVVEFSYGGLSGFSDSLHPKLLSTGIVFRLP